MKLKSLLLLISTISGVAYANIPGKGPYRSITTVNGTNNALVVVDSKGMAYMSHNGANWGNLFAFSSSDSKHYYAYRDSFGNGYFMRRKGNESWKYDDATHVASSTGNTFPNFSSGRSVEFIGASYDANQTNYALTTNLIGMNPQLYYRSNTQTSWTPLGTAPSSFLSNYIAIGSETGDYMVLGKNNSMLYNISGNVRTQPLPCQTPPSFLGVVPGNGTSYSDSYYLMCGFGNNAWLYWNDDASGHSWGSGKLFAPSASARAHYTYVMAIFPAAITGTFELSNKSRKFINPRAFVIVGNRTFANISGRTGPDWGRLCLQDTHTECSDTFSIPRSSSNGQVFAGSGFLNTVTNISHAVFVGNDSGGSVLDIAINRNVNPGTGITTLTVAPPVWH